MRLLFAPSVFPPESGGPATFVPDIGRSLCERGHEVVVVATRTVDPDFDERFPFEVVRVKQAGPFAIRSARWVKRLVETTHRFEPDLIFSNGSDLQPVIASKITETPLVSKIVGDGAWERATRREGVTDDIETFQHSSYGLNVWLYKKIRNFEIRNADEVTVPSKYLRDLVLSWGKSPSDTHVIYNALDLEIARPEWDERNPDVLTVARLVDWKGIEGVIDAFEIVAQTRPETALHIVGDGRKRRELEQHAERSSVSDQITFHGRVPHDRVIELMKRSRVFALNSSYEGLPHVVLEAMACGTPAVVSDAGGNPEVVNDGESGFVVSRNDIETMAERYQQILDDKDVFERFQKGERELLAERFDQSDMVDQYEVLFRSLVDES